MQYHFQLTDSLQKVFCTQEPPLPQVVGASMLRNESHSFQLVGWCFGAETQRARCHVEVRSELAPFISLYQVGYAPSLLPCIEAGSDDDYLTKEPGLFPDPLYPVTDGVLELSSGQARALWVCIEPQEMSGSFPVELIVRDEADTWLASLCYQVEILNIELPALPIRNTGWFHGDCLAVLHHMELGTEAYWELVERYLAVYTAFGHNMILTPIVTPPLDTWVGGERPTNQLVDITVEQGRYRFDFEKLRRWIELCKKYGIRYFEMAHLFTQWGASSAPKIVATVDGQETKRFGWETAAASAEYSEFLDAFLPELCTFLREMDIMQDCYFHVSDEPAREHEEQYLRCKRLLLRHIPEKQLIDALSDYSYFEKGIVSQPVVATDRIRPFLEHNVRPLWAYYCMCQRGEVGNRFMAMPSYRNRILGAQLYRYQLEGFLHWGFNFWFSERSREVLNPYLDTTAGGGFPSGDSFCVYPMDRQGRVICSLRLYVFRDAMQDLRALTLLECLTSREETEALLTDLDGFAVYPRSSEYLLRLRETVNQKIAQTL